MYKHIALIALLLPFSGYAITKEARIKELREAQFQKTLELKNICKQANDCAEFLVSPCDFYSSGELSPEAEELNNSIMIALKKAFNGTSAFSYDLAEELFDDPESIYGFNVPKGLYVRAATERQLLVLLVARYQSCLNDLWKISQELKNLEK